MIHLSIDPGKHGCGLAVWHMTAKMEARLLSAEYVPEADPPDSDLVRSTHFLLLAAQGLRECIAQRLVDWPVGERLLRVGTTFIERPKHYSTAQQKGDQADLLELSIVVGSIAQTLAPIAEKIVLIYPYEWKGQAPKSVTTARARKALSPEELQRVQIPGKTLGHNVWDAVALGLSQLRKGA